MSKSRERDRDVIYEGRAISSVINILVSSYLLHIISSPLKLSTLFKAFGAPEPTPKNLRNAPHSLAWACFTKLHQNRRENAENANVFITQEPAATFLVVSHKLKSSNTYHLMRTGCAVPTINSNAVTRQNDTCTWENVACFIQFNPCLSHYNWFINSLTTSLFKTLKRAAKTTWRWPRTLLSRPVHRRSHKGPPGYIQ